MWLITQKCRRTTTYAEAQPPRIASPANPRLRCQVAHHGLVRHLLGLGIEIAHGLSAAFARRLRALSPSGRNLPGRDVGQCVPSGPTGANVAAFSPAGRMLPKYQSRGYLQLIADGCDGSIRIGGYGANSLAPVHNYEVGMHGSPSGIGETQLEGAGAIRIHEVTTG